MPIILKNLLPTVDSGSWSATFSTDYAYTGTKSLKLTGTTSTAEVTVPTTTSIALNSTHTYYSRVYGYQTSKTSASVGFYWPIAEPSFKEQIAIKGAGSWQLYSGWNTRTSFSDGSYPFRLDFNNNYNAGDMYFDGAMLIDLTVGFGAGNEPTQDWCDANIPYFEGTKAIFFADDYLKYGYLPVGYTGLEYTESSGSQYIDTGVRPNDNTKVLCDFQLSSQTSNNECIFGATGQYSFRWYGSGSVFRSNGLDNVAFQTGISATDAHKVEKTATACTIDRTYSVTTTSAGALTRTLYLFAQHGSSSTTNYASVKIYSLQIYDSDTLIRDYIPALRKLDSVAGLYDIINGIFYPSIGTSHFSAGPEMQTYGLNLITDRTAEDVSHAIYLDSKWVSGKWTGTDKELTEWKGYLKGRYNAEDINRVGAAVEYISRFFNASGYMIEVIPATNWNVTEIPIKADMDAYLYYVEVLQRRTIPLLPTTPELPGDMDKLTYTEANNIEQILKDLYFLITNMAQTWFYSGDVYCGEI